jgi:predicted CXXCH cytochrome family protein
MRILRALSLTVALIVALGMLVLAAVLHRGFRSTTQPTWIEARLARTLRNAAIPRHERRAKNPAQGDPEALNAGRERFLTQCSSCHGVDGSGRTPMGQNLYPRVPDLRADETQKMTDGEIHYIIENGVQLTGMPAWRSPHPAAQSDTWPLVLFVRSLKPLTGQELTQQSAVATSAHYTGSQACEKCHEDIYQPWKKTPMANVVRDPHAYPNAIAVNPEANPIFKFSANQVAFVYGNLWKQRYFTKVGDDYFPLPVQWDFATHAWLPYNVPAKGDWWTAYYPADNMHRPTSSLCDGCHSVNYDIHTKQVAEWNVGCERCHGPGSEHVDHPSRANIANPAHMDSVAANDTCIQCHSQGRPVNVPLEGKYYDWPVGYRVGLHLQNFWKLEDCTLGQTDFYYFPDCTAHKNRMQGNDFAQSVMYHRGITCFSCHDVHGTDNYAQLRKPAEQICLDCHGPSSPNGPHTATLEQHTHHKSSSAGSQCVACHMPRIETEGVPQTFVHAHTFRFIPPEMTDKYKIPNSCNSCHTDKSNAWVEQTMKSWPEYSPWQL